MAFIVAKSYLLKKHHVQRRTISVSNLSCFKFELWFIHNSNQGQENQHFMYVNLSKSKVTILYADEKAKRPLSFSSKLSYVSSANKSKL